MLDPMQSGSWVCSPVPCLTPGLGSWTLETVERVSVKIDPWEKTILGGEEGNEAPQTRKVVGPRLHPALPSPKRPLLRATQKV